MSTQGRLPGLIDPRFMISRYSTQKSAAQCHDLSGDRFFTIHSTPQSMAQEYALLRDDAITSLCAYVCVQGIEKMRASCKLAADVLEYAGTLVKVRLSSIFLDLGLQRVCSKQNCMPSFDIA